MCNILIFITSQPLKVVQVFFSPMASGWAGAWQEKISCLGCISESVIYRNCKLGEILVRGIGVQCHGVTLN